MGRRVLPRPVFHRRTRICHAIVSDFIFWKVSWSTKTTVCTNKVFKLVHDARFSSSMLNTRLLGKADRRQHRSRILRKIARLLCRPWMKVPWGTTWHQRRWCSCNAKIGRTRNSPTQADCLEPGSIIVWHFKPPVHRVVHWFSWQQSCRIKSCPLPLAPAWLIATFSSLPNVTGWLSSLSWFTFDQSIRQMMVLSWFMLNPVWLPIHAWISPVTFWSLPAMTGWFCFSRSTLD